MELFSMTFFCLGKWNHIYSSLLHVLLLSELMHVCLLYVHMGVCMCACRWRPEVDIVFLSHSPPCFLRLDFSLKLDLTDQELQRSVCFCPSQCWGYGHMTPTSSFSKGSFLLLIHCLARSPSLAMGLLCSLGRPATHHPPISASHVLASGLY